MTESRSVDAVIVGAGAAGLSAARELARAGLRIVVLEARNRIGGRIYTVHQRDAALPVELGAEFIHGEPEETFGIVRAAALAVAELPDDHYWARDGHWSTLPDFWERITRVRKAVLRVVKRSSRRDISVADFLANGGLRSEDRALFQDFVEGYHAAYPERLSALWVAGDPDEEAGEDPKQFRLVRGYDGIAHALRAGLEPDRVDLRVSNVVTGIEWSRGAVVIRCHNAIGATLPPVRARAVLITVPVAVLRAGTITFTPEIEDKQRALRFLEAGQVFKMVVRFREAFWREEDFLKQRFNSRGGSSKPLNFLHAHEGAIPTWWTASPAQTNTITAWAGGPRADTLLNHDPNTQVDRVLNALAETLGTPRTRLDQLFEGAAMHDWRADPFSRAAYTFVGVNGSPSQLAYAKPVEGTLFFAGEATDAEQTGTVAGALASGRKAAKQLRRTVQAT